MSFPLVEKRVKFSTSSAAIFSGEKLSYAPSDDWLQIRDHSWAFFLSQTLTNKVF